MKKIAKMNPVIPPFERPVCKHRSKDGHCLAIGCVEVGDMMCECSWRCAADHQDGCMCSPSVLKKAADMGTRGEI